MAGGESGSQKRMRRKQEAAADQAEVEATERRKALNKQQMDLLRSRFNVIGGGTGMQTNTQTATSLFSQLTGT